MIEHNILFFAGRLGSGKTTLSRAVANQLGARWNSFGNTVRKIAGERSLPMSRQNLQQLGSDLVDQTPEWFCNRVVAEAEPNEGTFLWTLSWKLTTGIEYRLKYGLDYSILMKYEHVNTANQIEEVLNYFYSNIKCSCFGFSKGFAFYRFYECSIPKSDVAKKYLESQKQKT